MKKMYTVIVLLALLCGYVVTYAQSPYTLSPKWMVGRTSGMSFVLAGNVIGDPVDMPGNPDANGGQEATSTICSPDKNIAIYCNNSQVRNITNGLITTVNATNGHSSTGGSITLPDPANANNYYVISGNDITGGNNGGLNWYRISKVGAVYSVLSGPNSLATNGQVSEGIAVSADGLGGYWLISHTQGFPNEYWSWHVTTTGVGARVTSSSSCRGGAGAGGTIKLNKCQTRIALIGSQEVEVRQWDKATGMAGAVIGFSGSGSGPGAGYGGDFSPNGNVLYFSGLRDNLIQWDLSQTWAAGRTTIAGANSISGMSLGPNGKIYIARESATVAVINNPNVVGAGCNYNASGITLTGIGPNIGMATEAWLNPHLPVINATLDASVCNRYSFSIDFKDYFDDDISINTGTILWTWGHGGLTTSGNATPTHDFPTTGGPYSVSLSFTDQDGCQTWSATRSITISCSAPVKLLSFVGLYNHGNVNLAWQTAMELNNDYFELQRSVDGIHFETISTIDGAGSSSSILNYDYTDSGLTGDVAYYKLIQHDFDGTLSSSKIISIRLNKTGSAPVVLMPNPFSSSFMLTKLTAEKATVLIYDVLGRLLEQIETQESESRVELGASLSSGSYIVQYVTGSEAYTLRVEKK